MRQRPTPQPDQLSRIRPQLIRILAPILLLYGALGVLVELRFADTLSASFGIVAGQLSFSQRAPDLALLDPLWSHYAAQPALPWLALLLGFGLLLATKRSLSSAPPPLPLATPRPNSFRRHLPLLLTAVLLLTVGAYVRLDLLLPQSVGLTELPYDDEGVYAGASQLVLQGILPYRDYFFAHPPLAALVYAPAMAYHFTAWGSETSFMMARYLSVGYSLLVLLGFLLLGYVLGGRGTRGLLMGATAAGVWALDGRAIEINQKVMLDQPMLAGSIFALLLYLLYLRGGTSKLGRFLVRPELLLLLAGVLAAASALTKIQGIACFAALFVDLALRMLFAGQWRSRMRHMVSLLGGFVGGLIVFAGPFFLAAPDSFVRMILFFQVLRPSDGVTTSPDRIANLSLNLRNGVTLALASVGLVALAVWLWRKYGQRQATATSANEPQNGGASLWLPVVLWAFFNVLLFTYSRSFYNHYYPQIAAPLCIFAAAIWLLLPAALPKGRELLPLALPALALLIALPLAVAAWQGATSHREDRLFAIVSRYISDAVPPSAEVLTTDEQFNLLAARQPSHNSSGYLVDSYGHLIYMGLGLGERSYSDLLAAVRNGEHADDPDPIMHRPAPQADLLDRAARAALIVVHYNQGARRLTTETMQAFEQLTTGCPEQQIERQSRYVILRVCGR